MLRALRLAAVLGLTLVATASAGEQIAWEPSISAALLKGRALKKPLFVDVWAEWCGWCHEQDRTTYVNPEVVQATRDFVSVKVDAEDERSGLEFATRYRVDSLPTILFLTPQGRVIARLNGFQRPTQFVRALERVRDFSAEVMGWETASERTPEDVSAVLRLGLYLIEQEDYEEARTLLERAIKSDARLPVAERKQVRTMLGALRAAERRYAEAETLLKEGLALKPSDAESDSRALYTLGRVYLNQGRDQDARATLEKLVKLHPGTPAGARAKELLTYSGPTS